MSVVAKNFADRFGADAPAEARKRAEELREAGNTHGHAAWMLIYEAVKGLVEDGTDATKH